MGNFPVAAGCWTEMVVKREGGDLGSKNGSSVEEGRWPRESCRLERRKVEGRGARGADGRSYPFGRVDVRRGRPAKPNISRIRAKQNSTASRVEM